MENIEAYFSQILKEMSSWLKTNEVAAYKYQDFIYICRLESQRNTGKTLKWCCHRNARNKNGRLKSRPKSVLLLIENWSREAKWRCLIAGIVAQKIKQQKIAAAKGCNEILNFSKTSQLKSGMNPPEEKETSDETL